MKLAMQKAVLDRSRGDAANGLTPEEDSIGDPEDTDDEIDDLLPADLWFLASRGAFRPNH
jgi:hypothetical protein